MFEKSRWTSRLFLLSCLIASFGCFDSLSARPADPDKDISIPHDLAESWKKLGGKRSGKVIFARPPRMFILELDSARERAVPGIVTEGTAGRKGRGKSPRPFWSSDGRRFVYRYRGRIFVSDENGMRKVVYNRYMDCSDESRWSWFEQDGKAWLVGPSRERKVIMVQIDDPKVTRLAYQGGDVALHCEITGSGRYVVYDDDDDIFVTNLGSREKGIRVSQGQSCRPCASPDDRIAWLPAPHTRYRIHQAADGRFLGELKAPPGEEIYRMNWSNDPDYAAHMYGSEGNTRMHVRKISNGGFIYIGNGWDPDLWVGPSR